MLRECRRPIDVQHPISFSYPLPLVFKNMDTYNQPVVTIVQMIMSKQCYLPNIVFFSLYNMVIVLTSQNPPSLSLKDAYRPGFPMPMLTISAHLLETHLDFCLYIFAPLVYLQPRFQCCNLNVIKYLFTFKRYASKNLFTI